jgi:hypothetical protein
MSQAFHDHAQAMNGRRREVDLTRILSDDKCNCIDLPRELSEIGGSVETVTAALTTILALVCVPRYFQPVKENLNFCPPPPPLLLLLLLAGASVH